MNPTLSALQAMVSHARELDNRHDRLMAVGLGLVGLAATAPWIDAALGSTVQSGQAAMSAAALWAVSGVAAMSAGDFFASIAVHIRGTHAMQVIERFDKLAETEAFKTDLGAFSDLAKSAAAKCLDPVNGVWIVRAAGSDAARIMNAREFAAFKSRTDAAGTPLIVIDRRDDGVGAVQTIVTRTVNGHLHADGTAFPPSLTLRGDSLATKWYSDGGIMPCPARNVMQDADVEDVWHPMALA
jgi:hypothetical protein